MASSWAAISLRIGSTRPMPMKAITQAKATAQTARGCWRIDGRAGSRAGGGAVVVGGTAHGVVSSSGCRSRTSRSTATVVATSSAVWWVVGEPSHDQLGVGAADARELGASGFGEHDDVRPAVGRVRLAVDEALLEQCLHGGGHRGLAAAVGRREGGHADGAELVEQRQGPGACRVLELASYGAGQPGGQDDEVAGERGQGSRSRPPIYIGNLCRSSHGPVSGRAARSRAHP